MKPQDLLLNAVEVRVLGALMEKAAATPEYYPLTLNALTNACNQKSNREPVVSFEEKDVARAAESLREKTLIRRIGGPDHRVPKYGHLASEMFDLGPAESAALCVLLLRGPQTPGEVRSRVGRMHDFASLEDAEASLLELASGEGVWRPLAVRLPRQPGRKEARYAHLLSGPVEVEEPQANLRLEPATAEVLAENERLSALEAEVVALRGELTELREALESFRRQFE